MTQQHTSAPPLDALDALLASLEYQEAPINSGQSGNQSLRVPVQPEQPTWPPESSILGLTPKGWQGPTRDPFADAAQEPTPQWIQGPKPSQPLVGHYPPSAPSVGIKPPNHNVFENGFDIRKAPPPTDIWK